MLDGPQLLTISCLNPPPLTYTALASEHSLCPFDTWLRSPRAGGTFIPSMASSATSLNPAELASYPIIPPPPGVVSNFINPETHNLPLFIIPSLFLGVMGIFVLNRVYTKTCITRKYTWDDRKCRMPALLTH